MVGDGLPGPLTPQAWGGSAASWCMDRRVERAAGAAGSPSAIKVYRHRGQ